MKVSELKSLITRFHIVKKIYHTFFTDSDAVSRLKTFVNDLSKSLDISDRNLSNSELYEMMLIVMSGHYLDIEVRQLRNELKSKCNYLFENWTLLESLDILSGDNYIALLKTWRHEKNVARSLKILDQAGFLDEKMREAIISYAYEPVDELLELAKAHDVFTQKCIALIFDPNLGHHLLRNASYSERLIIGCGILKEQGIPPEEYIEILHKHANPNTLANIFVLLHHAGFLKPQIAEQITRLYDAHCHIRDFYSVLIRVYRGGCLNEENVHNLALVIEKEKAYTIGILRGYHFHYTQVVFDETIKLWNSPEELEQYLNEIVNEQHHANRKASVNGNKFVDLPSKKRAPELYQPRFIDLDGYYPTENAKPIPAKLPSILVDSFILQCLFSKEILGGVLFLCGWVGLCLGICAVAGLLTAFPSIAVLSLAVTAMIFGAGLMGFDQIKETCLKPESRLGF